MAEVAADTRGTKREGGEMRAETRPKDSFLHPLECKEDCKYGTFIGTLEKDNYQLRYNDGVSRVLGSNDIEEGRRHLTAVKYLLSFVRLRL